MSNLPTGTVTFLFTDIEGSTKLWQQFPNTMPDALACHHAILRDAIEAHTGYIFQIIGDAFCVAFSTATDGLDAALAAQRALREANWGETGAIRVRMALHTGAAEVRAGEHTSGEYVSGLTLSRAARLLSAGHGGQILLSLATAELVREQLPPETTLRDLNAHRLKDLIRPEHIYQVVVPDLPSEFPTLKSLSTRPNNLPNAATTFVGRHKELASFEKLIQDRSARMITILGPGGMGKTRFALEIAAEHLHEFENGAYFVPLAPISSPASIVPTIADSLSFSFYEGSDPQKQLLAYLREKQMLLVLDNYEHLLDGVTVVSEIVQAAERIKIIATSRERLGLQEEHLYPMQGMDFPDWETPEDALEYDAVKLFLQSARRIRMDFALVQDDLKYLARICRLVEGMPLAVELAAGWVETLSLKEIADEIQKSADILETDLRNIPERQRSIRAAFNYSWNMLADAERNLFKQLSIFRGGFTRPAAETIASATPRGLNTLANKSFLTRAPSGRFEIHELLRQYAEEQLKTSEVLQSIPAAERSGVETSEVYKVYDRHGDFYLEWLHQKESELKDRRQLSALVEMDLEIENARAAWMRAHSSNRLERIAPATNALMLFFSLRGRLTEGEELCRASLESTNLAPHPLLRAQILAWKGHFERQLGRTREVEPTLQQSLDLLNLADDGAQARSVKAFALLELGRVESFLGEREKAKQLYEQSLAGYRDFGDQWSIANVLSALGGLAWHLARHAEAEQLDRESLAIRQTIGDRRGIAESLEGLGTIYAYAMSGQLEEAMRLSKESLEIYREIGDQIGVAHSFGPLGVRYAMVGDFPKAIENLKQAIALHQELGLQEGVAWWTAGLGWALVLQGEYDRARQLSENSLSLAREIKHERGVAISLLSLGQTAYGLGDSDQANQLLSQAVEKFRQINQPIDSARSLASWGMTWRALGEGARAWQIACESLKLASEVDAWFALVDSLSLFAVMLADRGHIERAVEVYAMLRRYPFSRSPYFETTFGRVVDAAAASLPAEVVAAAQARGQTLDLHETARQLVKEFGNV
jgi:predicted ATPase/class 3 adenylate cyclase